MQTWVLVLERGHLEQKSNMRSFFHFEQQVFGSSKFKDIVKEGNVCYVICIIDYFLVRFIFMDFFFVLLM